jgi:prepilin-type N-terminal cleavage/methylation domain-containing protein
VSRKGFTLIELLVVISIVALLASIVLSSLNRARGKAADGSVKASLRQVGAQAELYLSNNEDLGVSANDCDIFGTVFADPKVTEIMADISTKLRTNPAPSITCATDDSGSRWAMSVGMLKGAGTTWCVDNNAWFGPGTVNYAEGECQ